MGVALILIWLTFGLAFYYAFHRPFTPGFAMQILFASRDLAITTLLFGLAGALGTRALPAISGMPLARFAARGALGLGALSLIYLVVGSTLGTGTLLAWGLWLLLAIWLRIDFVIWWGDASAFSSIWRSSGKLGQTTAVLCQIIFGASLFIALAPPLQFDALVYHLSLPKMYLAEGRIAYVPEIMYWGFPQLTHMLVTWQGAMGATHGALVAWGMGLLAAIGILGHMVIRLSPRRAWVALAALLCGSSLVTALASAYVDWPSILMAWGFILMLDLWSQKRDPRFAIWAGIFAGFAFGTKYTAGLLAVLGALVIVWIGKRDWRSVLLFLRAALALALPWLVRNALATGNPFYPLLLPGGEMDALRLGYYQGFAAQGNWLDAVLLPFRATWLGIEAGHIGSAPGYETSLGPLLLGLGVLALIPSVEKKQTRQLKQIAALIAIGGLLFWAIGGRITGHLIRSHLYYSLFPSFAILAAFGFAAVEKIKLSKFRTGRILGAVVCLALGLTTLQTGINLINSGVLQFWSGQISAETYVEKNLGVYAVVMKALRELPDEARVMMLWETRGYGCLPDCEPDEVIDRWPHDLAVYGTPNATIESWRAAGYTHVLYYALGARFIYEDHQHFHAFDLAELEGALSSLTLVQDFNSDYLLYSLSE